jgi:CubicO group peptidase (beta-lactamase class C family)
VGSKIRRAVRSAMQALRTFIEEQRELWEVPGLAVGVVRGGEVLLSEGFGTRELGTQAPVSARTIFPIGSTTKSFTAAAVGALVDDGALDWDRPVRDDLPGFAMHDAVATERTTVRDLLSHRSGLPRHEFVWLGHPDRSRADLVRRLRYLPLSKDIREAFQYSNLGYVTAGHLIELASGMPWEEFVLTRLLKPLGMKRSILSVAETQRDDDFSQPHERRGDAIGRIPFREFDQIGPAGGINSCIDDMLRYIQAQLGDGAGVFSSNAIAQMHGGQITIPEDRSFPESTRYAYGLGWLVGQYRGHRIVEHNGGVDGFLADCMMLPDDGIGVVVLTNFWSFIGPAIAYRAFDELLGLEPVDWSTRFKGRLDAARAAQKQATNEQKRVADAPPLRPLEDYAGDYEHPGYGTVSIAVEDGALVPRFGTLELSLTHRHHDVFDLEWHELAEQEIRFVLTFLTGPDGDVVALTVPFEETVEPIRFERAPNTGAA